MGKHARVIFLVTRITKSTNLALGRKAEWKLADSAFLLSALNVHCLLPGGSGPVVCVHYSAKTNPEIMETQSKSRLQGSLQGLKQPAECLGQND